MIEGGAVSKTLPFEYWNLFIFILSTLIGYGIIKYVARLRSNLPPGPTPLPFVGNLMQLRKAERLYKAARTYSKQFKSDIVTIDFGFMGRSIILNTLEAYKKAIIDELDLVSDRYLNHSFDLFSRGGKDVALAPVSETWKAQRKLGYQAFRLIADGDKISNFVFSAFEKQKQLMIEKLDTPLNPRDILAYGIFNAVCNLSYGKEYEIDDKEFVYLNSLNREFIDTVGNGTIVDLFPFLSFLPLKSSRDLSNMVNNVEEIVMKSYRQLEETYNSNEVRNISDAFIKVRKSNKDFNCLTDEHIFFLIFDIFGAGTDTNIDTLNWMIVHACRNPEIQNKVYKELKSVIAQGDYPNWYDRENLPYTVAFMNEVLRLGSTVPFLIPHKPARDCKLMGYDISKETIVLPNIYALHRDPRFWKDPEKFNPERFLDKSGKVTNVKESYFPFGGGRRVCLGESIARPLLFTFLTNLLFNFEFYVPKGEPVPSLDGIENQTVYVPDNEYKIAFRLR